MPGPPQGGMMNQCKVCDVYAPKVYGIKHMIFHPLGILVGKEDHSVIEMLCEGCVGWLNWLRGGMRWV